MDENMDLESPIVDVAKTSVETLEEIATKRGTFFSELWKAHQADIIRLGKVVLLSLLILIIAWLVKFVLGKLITKLATKYNVDVSLSRILKKTCSAVVLFFACVIILDLLGFNTSSVLTLLGAAGLAVGLALKDTLGNVAAGIFLLIQRPYSTGDFVDCASLSGTVKEIGLFTTKLQTLQGQDITVPNSSIVNSPITNYSVNPTRRADINIGISYSDNIAAALKAIETYLRQNPLVLQDPAPAVLVSQYSDSSVDLIVRFWTKNEQYWDAFFDVNKSLKGVIEGAGCSIPFPQRVVTIQK